MKHVIPVGTTEPQDFELRNDGVAIDGTGFTIAIEVYQRVEGAWTLLTGETTPAAPTVAWLSQAVGTVRVSGLDDAELPAGNYRVRFPLTDGSGKVGYFPNGDTADLWCVVAIPAR